jgi:nucleotide-binding universal stress UspA family protein
MIKLENVLVATDFSDVADAALAYGAALAAQFGARLHLLHVADNAFMLNVGAAGYMTNVAVIQQEMEEDARVELKTRAERIEPPPATAVVSGSPPTAAIIEYARANDVDLIVVGTHGRGGMSRLLLGSVAERLVRMGPCPVLTVHHPEREFVIPEAKDASASA